MGVTTAANAGVPRRKTAGLAASLLNASQQLGATLGSGHFAAIATSDTDHLLAAHTALRLTRSRQAFSGRYWPASLFLLAAAVIATRTVIAHGESGPR